MCIVSMNDGRWLVDCLESLAPVRSEVDILVVANACDDDTEEVCARAPLDIKVLRTEARLGFAACNNLALEKAVACGYEYVFLLNSDTRVHPGAVSHALEFMRTHAEFGVVGSLQIEYGDETWSRLNEWSRITLDHALSLGSRQERADGFTWVEHTYVQGAAMMLRAGLTRRVGLLDPVYHTFYEETDFCRRCRLAGRRVAILFDSKVQHYGGGNWKRDLKKRLSRDRFFLRNQFLFYISGVNSRLMMPTAALRVLARQLKAVVARHEDVILPPWQYVFVLWSAAVRVPDILRLHRRNRLIRAGGCVPECLRKIGEDRGGMGA